MDVKKIKNHTEKTWFIGTDVLVEGRLKENKDLELMEKGLNASLVGQYGSLYHVSEEAEYRTPEYKKHGYSDLFCSIIEEAHRRGYKWIVFDCDIPTEFKE